MEYLNRIKAVGKYCVSVLDRSANKSWNGWSYFYSKLITHEMGIYWLQCNFHIQYDSAQCYLIKHEEKKSEMKRKHFIAV